MADLWDVEPLLADAGGDHGVVEPCPEVGQHLLLLRLLHSPAAALLAARALPYEHPACTMPVHGINCIPQDLQSLP